MTQNDAIMLESVVEYCNRVNSRLVELNSIQHFKSILGVYWNIYRTVGSTCSRYQI